MATDEAATDSWLQREQAVFEVLHELLHRVDNHIEEQANVTKVTSVAADSLIADCMQILALAFVRREDTAVQRGADSLWVPEEEPARVTIDNWARGALSVVQHRRPSPATASTRVSTVLDDKGRGRAATGAVLAKTEEDGRPSSAMPVKPRIQGPPPLSSKEPRQLPRPSVRKPTAEELEVERRLRDEIAVREAANDYRRQQARRTLCCCTRLNCHLTDALQAGSVR